MKGNDPLQRTVNFFKFSGVIIKPSKVIMEITSFSKYFMDSKLKGKQFDVSNDNIVKESRFTLNFLKALTKALLMNEFTNFKSSKPNEL